MRGGAISVHGKNVRSDAGVTFRIRIEEVIGSGVVLVHAALDQAHAEDAGIEVEIFLCGSRDGGDVVESSDRLH